MTYRFNEILIILPVVYFEENDDIYTSVYRKYKGHRTVKTRLKRRMKWEEWHYRVSKLPTKV